MRSTGGAAPNTALGPVAPWLLPAVLPAELAGLLPAALPGALGGALAGLLAGTAPPPVGADAMVASKAGITVGSERESAGGVAPATAPPASGLAWFSSWPATPNIIDPRIPNATASKSEK